MPHPLAERIPQDSEFRVVADSAFTAVDNFRAKIRDIKSDKRFSAEGHLEKIRSAAKTGPLAYFTALRQQIASERKSLERRQTHFQLPQPDDSVVHELRRQEIRAWLRSIPNPGTRLKHAASNPDIAAAVVHSPAELSGLLGDGIDRARAFLLEHLHGPELATLRAEADIVDNVGTAIDVAETQLLNEFEPLHQNAAA